MSAEHPLPSRRAARVRSDAPWTAVQRWRGVALVAVVLVVTLWLAVTGQLSLYINPAYEWFTVSMTVIGLVLVVGAVALRGRDDDAVAGEHDHPATAPHRHEHDHPAIAPHRDEHDRPPARGVPRTVSGVGLAASTVFTIALLVLPPATLSSATAQRRDITAAPFAAETQSLDDAADADAATFATFTVAQWSSLLRQTSDPQFYSGKPVDVTGFVTPSPDDPDAFYVSRFLITHCTLDAQPVGVPVHLEGWQQSFAADDWVRVTGAFELNPGATASAPLALVPDDVAPTDQPDEPYLY